MSPHSLGRTYISLRAALHDDRVYIAEQVGHTNPSFTLTVYAKAVKRRERLSGAYLEAFEKALDWATLGHGDEIGASDAANSERAETADTA